MREYVLSEAQRMSIRVSPLWRKRRERKTQRPNVLEAWLEMKP